MLILETTMNLILSERKSIMSLTYIAVILMAYFGPNSQILGNIGLAIWQFQQPIDDIQTYVLNVSLLLVADLLSFFINGILLWYYRSINLLEALQKLQSKFWITFAIAETFLLMEVCSTYQELILCYENVENSLHSTGGIFDVSWKWT